MMRIPDADLQVETIYLGTGTAERPGGQHAGSPAAAIRVTHLPTGIMAQCGDCRSQLKNKTVAMEMVEWGLAAIKYPLTDLNRPVGER